MNRILKEYGNLRLWIVSILLGLFFSLCELIGKSFAEMGSLVLVIGNRDYILNSLGKGLLMLVLFSIGIATLYIGLKKLGERSDAGLIQHKFHTYFLTVFLVWLPVLIIFYPGTTNVTVRNEVFSFFGIANETTKRVNLLSEQVLINGHHSVFHTLLLGWCVSLGRFFGSDTFGLFLYTACQYLLFAAIIAAVMMFLQKLGVHKWIRRAVFFVYLFFPVFPLRVAVSLNKDELYSVLYLLFVLLCTRIIAESESFFDKRRNWVLLGITLLFIMLIRRNGLYALLLTAPFLLLVAHKKCKIKLAVLLAAVIVFFTVVISDIIYPLCSFTPGSKSSALAVPFQQTARYKLFYGNEVTPEEYEVINEVLDYEAMTYSPERASGVLPCYRKDATAKELKAYFEVWFQMFLKHPMVYVEATIHNSYGYYYPQTYRKEIIMEGISDGSNHGGDFNFHNSEALQKVRKGIYNLTLYLPKIPFVRLFFTTGIYTWIALFFVGFLFYCKKYRYMIAFIPLAVNVLICIASPVNTMLRYMLPVVICIPFLAGLCIHEAKAAQDGEMSKAFAQANKEETK